MQEMNLGEVVGDFAVSASPFVSSVTLDSFRNYVYLDLQLAPRFSVLVGENGQGKTNFLEALYLLSTTRLLRGQRDMEAIREGTTRARVAAELSPSRTSIGVTLEAGIRKRANLNGLSLPRPSDLIGRLPCVSVSTTDMSIVRGEPSDRRLFLDLELSSLFPAYLRHFTLYKRALDQRNSVLKAARELHQPAEVYEPWEQQMALHGAAIRTFRDGYVTRLSPRATQVHARMGSGEEAVISTVWKDPGATPSELETALEASRTQDIARGTTTVGPHRDDLLINVGGREARLYASQGQQRTAVISLKLATLELAHQELGASPMLLLDDIFSDLDEGRRALLVDIVLDNAGQVVLTCTEASAAGPRILEMAEVFRVRAGEVHPE